MPHEHGPKSQGPNIGAATAILFAKEGSQVVLVHYESDADADRTAKRISEVGKEPLAFATDIGSEDAVVELADKITEKFPKVDILVNNAGEQHVHEHLQDITAAEFT